MRILDPECDHGGIEGWETLFIQLSMKSGSLSLQRAQKQTRWHDNMERERKERWACGGASVFVCVFALKWLN